VAAFEAPEHGEKHGEKMSVSREESKNELPDEMVTHRLEDLKSLKVFGAEWSTIILAERRGRPVKGPFTVFFHGLGFSARTDLIRNKMCEGIQVVAEWDTWAIMIIGKTIANAAREKIAKTMEKMDKGGKVQLAIIARSNKRTISKRPAYKSSEIA